MTSAWVQEMLAKIDEDAVYASIGAYDLEAFSSYVALEKERLERIAADYPCEFCKDSGLIAYGPELFSCQCAEGRAQARATGRN